MPQAVVLDFDPLDAELAKAMRSGITREAAVRVVEPVRESMQQHLDRLSKERRLVLPAGATDRTKAEIAAKHLRACLD